MTTTPDPTPALLSAAPACSAADVARAIEFAQRLTASGAADDGTLMSRALLASRAEIASLTADRERLLLLLIKAAENIEGAADIIGRDEGCDPEDDDCATARAFAAELRREAGAAITEQRPPCPGEGWEWDAFALQWFQPGAKGKAIGRTF